MVAVAQFIPKDPEHKESILAVLREHPELKDFILRSLEHAEAVFPEVQITLDAVQYDEWDLPVTLTLYVTQPWHDFNRAYDAFLQWLVSDPDYQRELILVMPVWHGPLDSYS